MKRSLLFAVPLAVAACFAVTGCTIYTYDSPPPKHKPARAKPSKTRPRPAGTSGGNTTNTVDAPTVQGSTIFGSGTPAAFTGEAFVIPEGTKTMPNFDDLVPFAVLYTDQFNVPSQTFSGGFPGALLQDEWFAIRYTGKIMAPVATKWTFKLVSDDGAILYIDGNRIVDNDGVHTAKTSIADYDLTAGQHSLELTYFQEKKGTVALQLFAVVGGKDVPIVGVR